MNNYSILLPSLVTQVVRLWCSYSVDQSRCKYPSNIWFSDLGLTTQVIFMKSMCDP